MEIWVINMACASAATGQRRARHARRARLVRNCMVSLCLSLAQMALPVRFEPARSQAAPAHGLVLAQAITRVLNLGAAAPVL